MLTGSHVMLTANHFVVPYKNWGLAQGLPTDPREPPPPCVAGLQGRLLRHWLYEQNCKGGKRRSVHGCFTLTTHIFEQMVMQ